MSDASLMCESGCMAHIDAERVREHVRNIEASKTFAESERLRRFLRFTVESKLAGTDARVKEYVLGREVFDRSADYDPRLDPIVRVEARRLRQKLDEYYGAAGRNETIRLSYPRGTYLPEISMAGRSRRDAPMRRSSILRLSVAVGVALVLALSAAAAYRTFAPRPMVAVVPAQWFEGMRPDLDPAAIPIAEAVTSQIANSQAVPVIAWPIVQERRAHFATLDETARALGAPVLVTIIAERSGKNDVLHVFVVDTRLNRKLRAAEYTVPAGSTSYDALAARVVGDVRDALR